MPGVSSVVSEGVGGECSVDILVETLPIDRTVPGQSQIVGFATERSKKRAGWDSNPRFAAPQAAVLVLARLPAH